MVRILLLTETLGITDYGRITFYDITNPSVPVKKESLDHLQQVMKVFRLPGNYSFIPDGDSLKIYNISDLMSPTYISKVRTGGYGYLSAVDGDYCYVASEGTGIRAINISNLFAPVEAGFYDGVPQSRVV